MKRQRVRTSKGKSGGVLNRKTIISALNKASPGLAKADLIPILTHYWFTGEEIVTYNDQVAISVPLKTEFVGSAPGDVLQSVLSNSVSEDITFSSKGNHLQLAFGKAKSGKSTIKLPSYGKDDFLFRVPESTDDSEDNDCWLDVESEDLVAAVTVCMQSLGSHISQPERRGITLTRHGKKRLYFYSTDGRTISRSEIGFVGDLPFSNDVILPESFCKEILTYDAEQIDHLEIHEDDGYALLVSVDGTRMFGRLMKDPNPPDFHRIFDLHLPDDIQNEMTKFPAKLTEALDRALIVASKATEYKSVLTVDEKAGKNVMAIHTESNFGEVRDEFRVGDDVPRVTARIDLKAMALTQKTASEIFDHMYVDPEVVVLSKGDRMFHMIANYA